MIKWTSNKVYPNMLFCIVNNKNEYIEATKALFDKYSTLKNFSCDQLTENEHIFDNNYELWHSFFDTECIRDERYEDEYLPNPKDFNGDMRNAPNEDDRYPLILLFINEDGIERIITWQSLNELIYE